MKTYPQWTQDRFGPEAELKYLSGEANHLVLAYNSSAVLKADDKSPAQATSNYLFVLRLKTRRWRSGQTAATPQTPGELSSAAGLFHLSFNEIHCACIIIERRIGSRSVMDVGYRTEADIAEAKEIAIILELL
jgi:hypothetical protein